MWCKLVNEVRAVCARATSDRNEVSQREEVRVWIPDGQCYMDVKQHSIQNFSFIVRAARLALSVRPRMAEPDPSYMEVLQLNSYQNRNEVSQYEEVRVWIPDGRIYMDVKQPRALFTPIYNTRKQPYKKLSV